MRRFALCVVMCVLAPALITGLGQTRFRSSTAAVRVDALVTNGNQPVPGLTASDFELRDNGVLQTITDVHHEELPLNVICVLDLSGSVRGAPLTQLKDAVAAVIDALAGPDRAALLTFASRLSLHTTLTSDRARLHQAVNALQAAGTTSILDAVFAGLALREADERRTVLLLLTDGRDTSSWLSARQVIDAARRTDVVIYPITVGAEPTLSLSTNVNRGRYVLPRREEPARHVLRELADDTGGRLILASNEGELRRTFLATLDEFRKRYVLSYEPAGVTPGGWHEITVKLRGRAGTVRARRGYSGN